MNKLTRHALTYFATFGILLLLIGGMLLFALISTYNSQREFNLAHAVVTMTFLILGDTFLIAGVTTHIAARRGYMPPPIGDLPKAKTVALIPAYNEEKYVRRVVEEARKYVDLVIVVDDGSTDKTTEEATKAGAVVIRHPKNMGYGAAIKTLLRAALAADAEYAVQLDADGQHNPADIPKFLEALKQGTDMVIGNRFLTSKIPMYRKFGIYIIRTLLRLLQVSITDPENGFRAYNRRAIQILEPQLVETWMGISAQAVYLATKSKLKIAEVPTTVTYGPDTSTEMPITHGLSVVWTIIWTWLTHNPIKTLALGSAGLAVSVAIYTYVLFLFNITRYIRLTYTTLSLLLAIISAVVIAIAISTLATKKQ